MIETVPNCSVQLSRIYAPHLWSPTGKPVAPLSFAASLRERRDLVVRHPDHKRSGLKPWLSAVGVIPLHPLKREDSLTDHRSRDFGSPLIDIKFAMTTFPLTFDLYFLSYSAGDYPPLSSLFPLKILLGRGAANMIRSIQPPALINLAEDNLDGREISYIFQEVEMSAGVGHFNNKDSFVSGKEVAEKKKSLGTVLKGDETLLLVDDEDIFLEVGKDILEVLGYKVFIAGSGKEAIDIYSKNHEAIDMVILDMIMPDTCGGETYDTIKKINPKVKTLLSSGYSLNGQATDILERGCNGFIQKPFSVKELSEKIREVLSKN